MIEAAMTTLISVFGLLLIGIVFRKPSYDFWMGSLTIAVLYLVVDFLMDATPITYYTGFNWQGFFFVVTLYVGLKLIIMGRPNGECAESQVENNKVP